MYLRLGEAYRELGQPDRAMHHCKAGRATDGASTYGRHGAMVRDALERLADRIPRPRLLVHELVALTANPCTGR